MFDAKERRGVFHYQNLSKVELSPEQKRYLIEEFVIRQEIPVGELAHRYTLNRQTMNHWKDTVQSGGYIHAGRGRPPSFDSEAIRDLHNELGKRKLEQKPADAGQVTELANQYAHEAGLRQNRVVEEPHAKTVKTILHGINAKAKKPQIVSNARFKAGSDVRMVYSMWIMAVACSRNIPKQFIWNWDGTTFIVTVDGKNRLVITVKVEGDTRPLSLVDDESLDIFIKWMHMGSAAGEAIPFVLLVAVDALGPDECEVFEVPGMTYTVVAGTVGYLCFTKTRAGNAKFFNWFIRQIVIPKIEAGKIFYKIETKAFTTCDGEAMILDEVFNKEIQKELIAAGIDLGKIPASCSGILQPSDVSPLFRATKTKLRSMLEKYLIGDNPVVEEHIMTVLAELQERHSIAIGSEQKKKIAHGAISVARAAQEVVRPRLIEAGFTDCGQYPLNFEKLMNQCYTTLTPEVLKTLRAAEDANVEYFLEHGYLSEEQMTLTGIPICDGERGIPRDQAVLHHQRAVLLTHDATRERHQEYVNRGLPLGDTIATAAMPKEQKAQAQKDIKLVARVTASEKKKEDNRLRKEQQTEEEKAEEKEANRIKRETNRLKKLSGIADAKDRLGLL